MSSSEEDVDYAPTKDIASKHSEASSGSSSEEFDSGASESEAEFTDSEEEGKAKKAKSSKRTKPAPKKTKSTEKRSRFLDTEAQVGNETDEDDEGSDEFLEDFIANEDEEEEAAAAAAEIRARRPVKEQDEGVEEFDAEAEERRIRSLYGRVRETAKTSGATASAIVPRPFLLPTVTDPKLWLCRAQQGRERSSALALLRVVMERQFSGQPLQIFSIIARDGLKGYVYIEAHKPVHIAQAIEVAKLNHCLYPGQAGKSLVLVPLAEMPQVLQTTAASAASGSAAAAAEIPDIAAWVRVKRGRYANDLAQVVDNAQDEGSYDPTNLNTCIIRVKLIPRLSFTTTNSPASTKDRAPPRLFDPEEASRYGPVSKSRGFWIYGGETYRDGFLYKNIRLSSLVTSAVTPSLEELARFPDSDRTALDSLSGSSEAAGGSHADISLAPGDQVVVIEGDMKNLQASVDSLEWRPSASTGRPEQFAHLLADASTGLLGESARFTIKVAHLRKIFAVGAQIRVLSGVYVNEIGIVVAIDDKTKNLIVFASGSNKQFTVPAGICALSNADNSGLNAATKPAASSAAARARSNDYSLDDLVQFEVEMGGEEGVGVVIRILDSENSVAVFDSLGQIRNIPCRAVSLLANYNDSSNSYSAAWESNLKQGDRVIEKTSGAFYKVLHIYKSLAFVRPLSGAIPSGSAAITVLPADNISKPRPAPVPSFRPGSGPAAPVGHLIGKSVSITGGPQKGYVGFVKQVADNVARVELHTNGKIISVSVNNLALVSAGGKGREQQSQRPASDSTSAARTPAWNSATGGGKTPGWGAGSSGGKTPGWNSGSSRTPGWSQAAGPAGSSKTPAWNAAASTARTPAWNPSTSTSTTPSHPGGTSRTPAWSTASGMTPAWNVPTAVGQSNTAANWQKGTTPAWNSTSARTPAWSRPSDEQQEPTAEDKEKKEKQPWDQVNNWKKD